MLDGLVTVVGSGAISDSTAEPAAFVEGVGNGSVGDCYHVSIARSRWMGQITFTGDSASLVESSFERAEAGALASASVT